MYVPFVALPTWKEHSVSSQTSFCTSLWTFLNSVEFTLWILLWKFLWKLYQTMVTYFVEWNWQMKNFLGWLTISLPSQYLWIKRAFIYLLLLPHFEVLQWHFSCLPSCFCSIRFWNPSDYLCWFYISPCRVTGLQTEFATITSSTCVNAGWVDIIGWYATAVNHESSSYYLCPCTADKAPCW